MGLSSKDRKKRMKDMADAFNYSFLNPPIVINPSLDSNNWFLSNKSPNATISGIKPPTLTTEALKKAREAMIDLQNQQRASMNMRLYGIWPPQKGGKIDVLPTNPYLGSKTIRMREAKIQTEDLYGKTEDYICRNLDEISNIIGLYQSIQLTTEVLPMNMVAKIWLDEESGAMSLRTPFNAAFVAQLKTDIPRHQRRWVPDKKIWQVEVEVAEHVTKIMREHYDEVIVLEGGRKDNALDLEPFDFEGIDLKDVLEPEDLKAVKRFLVKRFHPDLAHGNADKMAKVNKYFNTVLK